MKQFLSDRLLLVRVGCILSEACALEKGIPQDSILSVTLIAVVINSVISVLPDGVHSSLYVDDLSISFSTARMPLIDGNSNFRLTGFPVGLLNMVSSSQPRRQ